MNTLVGIAVSCLLLSLTACSSGDAGMGAGVGAMALGSSSGSVEQTFPGGDCYSMDSESCLAYKATNVQRVAHGLAMMSFCQACYEMSFEQSRDMAVRGYFDHQRPEETFSQRATRFGLSQGAGENIAWGKVGAVVVDMWMNSAGHRANILDPRNKSFAVGTYGLYTTQVFYRNTDR